MSYHLLLKPFKVVQKKKRDASERKCCFGMSHKLLASRFFPTTQTAFASSSIIDPTRQLLGQSFNAWSLNLVRLI